MAADRAINMALRVVGIGEVERDFRKVGQAGEQGFEKVERGANKADRAVSAYTERLRRTVEIARRAFDNQPGVAEARSADPAGYIATRNQVVLAGVEMEKKRIQQGLRDNTFDALGQGVDRSAASLGGFAVKAATVTVALEAMRRFVVQSAEAYMEHERALDAFNAELALTGNRSQASAQQIEDMAARIVRSTLQTEEAALGAARVLAQVPAITAEGLEAAVLASARFADASGRDVIDVAKQMGDAMTALANDDMAALVKAMEGLNDPLKATVYQLAEVGRTAEAQQALLKGLTEAAGDGPDGLTAATNRLSDAWERLKIGMAEQFAGPVVSGLDFITGALSRSADESDSWAHRFGQNVMKVLAATSRLNAAGPLGYVAAEDGGMDPATGYDSVELNRIRGNRAKPFVQNFEARYGAKSSKASGRGGSSGRSAADRAAEEAKREAERLKRESEQARNAADRVIESNEDVVDSYVRRAREVEEKVGLEGATLEAVERRHAIEGVLRRLNIEEIEKEVEARRAAAAAAGEGFDEAAATRDATAALAAKTEALREAAKAELDAAEATALFNARQAEARALVEGLQTPLDVLNDEVDRAIVLLRAGAIEADEFDRRMDQLAEGFADVAYAADEGAQAWRGFGYDVGRTLSDIALNGGSARDILQELIRLPLERLLEQQLTNPVADWIDRLTGNSRPDNVAAARAGLPGSGQVLGANVQLIDPAAQSAALSLNNVGATGIAAAQGLQMVALSAGNPIESLALQSEAAAEGLGGLVPMTGRFGGALAQVLAQIGGGGGGGGWLGAAVSLGTALISGGAGGGAAVAHSTGMPPLYASGTDRLPTNKPFWVGENGRELMEKDSAGNLRVYSNQDARRMASTGGSTTVINHISVPARADPRRTASSVSRGMQQGMARASGRGIASPAGGSR